MYTTKIKANTYLLIVVILMISCNKSRSRLDYLKSIKKIDVHTHVRSNALYMKEFMDEYNFKSITICTSGADGKRIPAQRDTSIALFSTYPRYYAWITTFDLTGIFQPGWSEIVIKQLKEDFDNGAIGVKIWKSVGMDIQNEQGEFIQLDDPVFKPIFHFIAEENKTLIAHIGEPIHAWMPTFTTKEGIPRNYWATHPEYSFYDHPEKPSYTEIMAARDHVLANHPNLRFVGAHLASLEFDVDEIAIRMDMHPNFAVEIGGRMRYLAWQARGKVRAFFIKYQDRIMYGTDRGASASMTIEQYEGQKNGVYDRYELFARYLATNDEIPWGNLIRGGKPRPEPSYTIKGLDLPKEVLENIFYRVPIKWFPGVEFEF